MNDLPKGDEILYSTLCDLTDKVQKKARKWRSHVLLTSSGIAFNEPTDEGETRFKFFNWKNIPGTLLTEYKGKKCKFNDIWFSVINDENYESNSDFKKRVLDFSTFCENTRYEIMKKNSNIYVPIGFTSLAHDIPQNEEILYSTLCAAVELNQTATKATQEKWNAHCLVTRSGTHIYYPSAKNIFLHWAKFTSFKKEKIAHLRSFRLKVIRHENFESEEVFNSRASHFGPFCSYLKGCFENFLEMMMNCAKDKNYLSERISKKGFDNFLKDLEWYLYIKTSYGKPQKEILQNLLEAVPEDTWQNRHELLTILKEKFNLHTKEEKRALKLYNKGIKCAEKNDFEAALSLYEEALKIYPYNTNIQKKKIEVLQTLGKTEEV